jgi:RND superfamily putative drug exporter
MKKFGEFIVKWRWLVAAVWLVATVLIVSFAPSLSSIESDNQSSFLPDSYESVQASKLAKTMSKDSEAASDIVVFKEKSGKALSAADLTKIQQVVEKLSAKHLSHVESFTTSSQQLAPSKKAQLATVVYSGSPEDKATINAVQTVRDNLNHELHGTSLVSGVTGQEAISYDTQSSSEKALKIVSIGTLLLVLFLPAFVFRSPLAGLLPLFAVGVVFTLSNSLIAIAGNMFDFKISQQLSVLFTVVLFGIGTDYILFLLFRYRERLRTGDHTRGAVAFALSRAGEAILSAALVVLTSFVALFFAKFGIFSSFAPGLVICVAVMMLAALTLVPALVAIIGEKVFWPSKSWVMKSTKPTISKKIGGFVARRPALVATIVVVALGIVSLFALQYKADFSSFSQPPKNTPSAEAYNDLTGAFPAGALSPGQIYITSNERIANDKVTSLVQKLNTTKGISSAFAGPMSSDGKTATIQYILKDDPYSAAAISNVLGPIREAAHSANSADTHVYVGGGTSAIADVKKVTDRDLSVVFPIAAAFIFVILAVLLRSLVAPIVLLLCVSLGYATTLGATTIIFQNLGHNTGLISFIPLFLYLFVVAIGTDYNILTITRLREEVREGNSPRKAADLTIEHSSATVVSAGLILAATFASLILGGISFLSQMGASISIGVMLSAFIIAPFLIPSLSAKLGYTIWWPGHKPTAKKK